MIEYIMFDSCLSNHIQSYPIISNRIQSYPIISNHIQSMRWSMMSYYMGLWFNPHELLVMALLAESSIKMFCDMQLFRSRAGSWLNYATLKKGASCGIAYSKHVIGLSKNGTVYLRHRIMEVICLVRAVRAIRAVRVSELGYSSRSYLPSKDIVRNKDLQL